MDNIENYKKIAIEAREKVLELIYKAQTSHIGSNFSCLDLLTVLFEKANIKKDKLIVSKGWVAASIYTFLAYKGIIPKSDLKKYCRPGSKYIGLIEPLGIFGCEFAGGSMQLGDGASLGFALAKKLKQEDGKIYVLESDGGVDGGIFWESVLLANQFKLNNLVWIIDANGFQAMGKKNEIVDIEPLKNKFKNFGWYVKEINGHDFYEIERALNYKHSGPYVIIARTEKGFPVSFMRGNNFYHYANLTTKMYKTALKELNAQ